MPSHRVHRALAPPFIPVYPDVDQWMDEPSKWLGSHHRKLRHSPIELMLRYPGDWGRIYYGMWHIMLDRLSEDKNIRKALELYGVLLE